MTILFRCVGAIFNDLAGIADDDAVARYIKIDIRIWRNQHTITNRHFTNNSIFCQPNFCT